MITKVMLVLTIIFGDVVLKTPLMVLLRQNDKLDAWTKELDYIAQVAIIQTYNMGLYREGTVIHIRGDTPSGNTINISNKIMDNDVDINVYDNFKVNVQPDMDLRFSEYMQQQYNEKRIVDFIVNNIS